jgi:hypothetical protein
VDGSVPSEDDLVRASVARSLSLTPHVHVQVLPSFPNLEAAITKAIEQLGGRVFAKLNWSAPQVGSLHLLLSLCSIPALALMTLSCGRMLHGLLATGH